MFGIFRSVDSSGRSKAKVFFWLVVLLPLLVVAGCKHGGAEHKASVRILRVPDADPGGPVKMDFIEGTATTTAPGEHIVLYAKSNVWWIQPFVNQELTNIQSDSSWKNTTHLGTDYAALLVEPGYRPLAKLQVLPPVGDGVLAVAKRRGRPGEKIVSKVIHFSGYQWIARAAGSDRGGAPRFYDPANAWVDAKGYLHLRMDERNGKWYCAEINLKRSLGFGTYRFVVQDTSHLPPTAVVGMFTYNEGSASDSRNELDIELSKWGDPSRRNAQYVVQPFYVPENVYRFNAPAGTLTYSFRWEPDRAAFKTSQGGARGHGERVVSQHAFTVGIPNATGQTAHIDLYDFHYSKLLTHKPAEVVIEKFEYLP